MKKNSFYMILISLILVLLLSYFATTFLVPLIEEKTNSQSYCLNDRITEDMTIEDIAKMYRDEACVAVKVNAYSKELSANYTSQGSGVCVASKGYNSTSYSYSSLEEISVQKGSYIATNYHVINWLYDENYSNIEISIINETGDEYEANVIWSNKDFDIALLYCQDIELGFVEMKDRSIYCEEGEKLDIEKIFAIGTPLSLQYLNRVTFGNVASNNSLTQATANTLYYYYNKDTGYRLEYVTNKKSIPENTIYYEISYLNNLYEDVIDLSLGISSGNSGGGVFDSKGNLIGLTTLSSNYTNTNGNQMNGAVPIYPLIKVLDRIISNNEYKTEYRIYLLEDLGLTGIDSNEASYVTLLREENLDNLISIGLSGYYTYEGKTYSIEQYQKAFSFLEDGIYILSNENSLEVIESITKDCIIKEISINGEKHIISNRNDILYNLITIMSGDNVLITFQSIDGQLNSVNIKF